MNHPAASSGVSKTTTGKTLRPKGRGIHPDGNKWTFTPPPESRHERDKVQGFVLLPAGCRAHPPPLRGAVGG